MKPNLDKVVEIVTETQEQAAAIMLQPEKHPVDLRIIQKEGKDYTTAVDIAVENFQKKKLRQEFPEIGFLGEETPTSKGERYFWIVDPIDGTAVYSTGGEYYSNSIALADRQDGKVIFGSVYQPATQRFFLRLPKEVWAIETITERNGQERKIAKKPIPSQSKGLPELMSCVILPSKYREQNKELYERLAHLFEQVEFPELKRKYGMIDAKPASGSSALFCCDIASGNRHFYMGYFQKPWDLAVGSLYARDAGCIVEVVDDNARTIGDGQDLERIIASGSKNSLVNIHVFANRYVREIVMNRSSGKFL